MTPFLKDSVIMVKLKNKLFKILNKNPKLKIF